MTDLDLTESIIPKSDQLNADEMHKPATYTIREVITGKAEQPFDFLLVETDRAYRPSKTMRRVIVGAWGSEAANYAGRRLTLYREPSITFGGQKVGGIRISHMSDIPAPVVVMAQTTRGKRETFTVQPLEAIPTTEGGDPPSADRPDEAATSPGMDTNAAAGTEALPPLRSAVAGQLSDLSSHEKARLKQLCADLNIEASRDGLITAWGEGARDLRHMIETIENRVKA